VRWVRTTLKTDVRFAFTLANVKSRIDKPKRQKLLRDQRSLIRILYYFSARNIEPLQAIKAVGFQSEKTAKLGRLPAPVSIWLKHQVGVF